MATGIPRVRSGPLLYHSRQPRISSFRLVRSVRLKAMSQHFLGTTLSRTAPSLTIRRTATAEALKQTTRMGHSVAPWSLVTVTTPASGTISQYLATAKIDSNNNITVYGGVPLGTTGPNTFAYGEGGASAGGANGNGGQGQLAAVNSTMVGGWYTWKAGDLAVIPEVQGQWTQ